jgi:hypothetical protein
MASSQSELRGDDAMLLVAIRLLQKGFLISMANRRWIEYHELKPV